LRPTRRPAPSGSKPSTAQVSQLFLKVGPCLLRSSGTLFPIEGARREAQLCWCIVVSFMAG